MVEVGLKRRSEVRLTIATQCIRAEIKSNPKQRRRPRTEASRRTELKLDFSIAKDWRADELLDAFDQVSRGDSAPDGGKDEAQGCANISVVIYLQNLQGSPKTLNQRIELLSIVERVDFEPHG